MTLVRINLSWKAILQVIVFCWGLGLVMTKFPIWEYHLPYFPPLYYWLLKDPSHKFPLQSLQLLCLPFDTI